MSNLITLHFKAGRKMEVPSAPINSHYYLEVAEFNPKLEVCSALYSLNPNVPPEEPAFIKKTVKFELISQHWYGSKMRANYFEC